MPLDEFAGDSGLKDDWDGTITEAEFQPNDEGAWRLKLYIAADDGDDQEVFYSVGGKDKGWTSYDGGETISGSTAKARFHVRSNIQAFIDRVMQTEAADVLRRRSAELYNHRGPFHAALWLGLKFHWDVVEEDGRIRQADGTWVDGKVQAMRPTKFLGENQIVPPTSGPKAAAPQQQTAPTAAPTANGANGDASGIAEADLATLTKLALTHDTFESWMDAAMEAQAANGESFLKVPAVRKVINKKDFYESLRG